MTKSAKVKIILIITFLSISALIMTYRYFTEFKQTQIDKKETATEIFGFPLNQFEFADENTAENSDSDKKENNEEKISQEENLAFQGAYGPQVFVNIEYSTQPLSNIKTSKEMADRIAFYGKDPTIQNFVKDMNKALGIQAKDFNSLPPAEVLKKQLTSTQTQKILLQYSKDPAFRKAVKQIMQDPVIMTGFLNYIKHMTYFNVSHIINHSRLLKTYYSLIFITLFAILAQWSDILSRLVNKSKYIIPASIPQEL